MSSHEKSYVESLCPQVTSKIINKRVFILIIISSKQTKQRIVI